jgi:hypothetical protein
MELRSSIVNTATVCLLIVPLWMATGEENKGSGNVSPAEPTAPHVYSAKQGYSMRLWMDNRGVLGRQGYPGGDASMPNDSLGLEYPIGQRIEHLFGGGVWVGALSDTSKDPTVNSPPIKAVSYSYEGWGTGGISLYETYPGMSLADSIWKIPGRDAPKPAGWDAYWGNLLPYHPISDNDFCCTYTDYGNPVSGHVPFNLRVVQSSYAWDDPYADAIIIIEYKFINEGIKPLDSTYIGFFFEADVGPRAVTNYYTHNFTGYYKSSRTAYIHNPIDRGSTPVGATLLQTPKPLDSLRYTFAWFPGNQTPANDQAKYALMSSGQILPDEYPALSDTRFIFAFGPFTIRPVTDPNPDTLKIAMAIVSGFSKTDDPRIIMQRNADRALDIYLNQGIRLPATPPSPPLRATVGFRRVELDWKWRPGDDVLYGRANPEANWDTTNVQARRDPARFMAPHPIGTDFSMIDTTKGGRNFEAYRLWRSENPNQTDDSFTLLKQFDVVEPIDSVRFQYDTGLQYTYIDSNLVRGKTYVYAVTSVSIPNLVEVQQADGSIAFREVEPLESAKRTNAVPIDLPFAVSREANQVAVVPNPYRTDANYTLESGGYEGLSNGWDETRRLVKFINLPERCTIRVFSLSGDLIRTLHHDGGGGAFPDGDENMPLVSESNRALASGIYIYTVESEFGTQTGKFVIIR